MSFVLPWGTQSVSVIPHSEEPDLTDRFDQLFPSVWPEFNQHSDVFHQWERLYEFFPSLQFVLVNERTNDLLARGNTIPFVWDGDPDHLPEGVDALAQQALTEQRQGLAPNTLSAISAEVPLANRSKGLGRLLLKAMSVLAAEAEFSRLVAPLRPNRKYMYPLTPIEQYVQWKNADGLPFDPWMRIHVLLGATVSVACPRSMKVSGTVAQWESWTGMAFPATGTYVFPNGLATLEIDRSADRGVYWEPNVWMLHPDPRPE